MRLVTYQELFDAPKNTMFSGTDGFGNANGLFIKLDTTIAIDEDSDEPSESECMVIRVLLPITLPQIHDAPGFCSDATLWATDEEDQKGFFILYSDYDLHLLSATIQSFVGQAVL